MEQNPTVDEPSVEPGEAVYTETGRLIGRISGYDNDSFEVEPVESDDRDGVDQEEIPGQEFGEGYLMWQCGECGEMGELDDSMPESCPSCGAPREAVSMVRED